MSDFVEAVHRAKQEWGRRHYKPPRYLYLGRAQMLALLRDTPPYALQVDPVEADLRLLGLRVVEVYHNSHFGIGD